MKFQTFIFAFVFALIFPFLALAQEPAAPHFLDGALSFLENGWIQAGLVMLFEAAIRVKPTEKPKSLLVLVKYVLDAVVVFASWLSALCGKLSSVANNVKR